jgi:uncharacterized protein DUF3592
MGAKLGAAAICVVAALGFGGVGVFASWMIATMVYDGTRAREWTEVHAEAVSERGYRYDFGGREYRSERWGLDRLGGSDNIDTWYRDMTERMRVAFKEHRPVTVYVNPQDPSQAVVDRNIRWKQVLLFVPFAICFGGVGLGALWMLPRVLRGSADDTGQRQAPAPAAGRTIKSDVRGSVIAAWLFAIFWNALAMPVSIGFVPDLLRQGEWLALLILLFPLVGLFLLWSAISSTMSYLRHGSAVLDVLTAEPRAGGALQGSIAFARGVSVGDPFRVELECIQVDSSSNKVSTSKFWSKECAVQASQAANGPRVDFRFDVPETVPPTSTDANAPVRHKWRVAARPASQRAGAAYGFDVALLPPRPSEEEFALANDPAIPAEVDGMFDRLGVGASNAKKRAAFAQLAPEEQAALAKYATKVPSMKVVVIVIVCIVAAVQYGPMLVEVIRALGGRQ